ncbi:MAG: hypothetical protein A2Y82_03480 [Candidatus Buchananbacteria bacterium RBG_13_36_9]|uniref:DUF5666 domain-containing protein n=1 Tax=Candidatus Buchananbacteria bacterium RBG_13_36_9 TaxID=1797530 RepID=A0A1G1XLV9_9BACT|nr:MAG: hypothetical protein A2Y82_03480 [Candidatus Buchananbacteria bacterium RBG_13_36_9]
MKKNLPIFILLIIIIAAGSFYGGMLYGKSQSRPGDFRNFMGKAPDGNFRGSAKVTNQNFINGEILSMDDKSITVKIPDNGSKIIFYSQTTTVSKTVDGVISDLKVGDNIMASGESNSDGSVTAKTIQIRPQMPENPLTDQPVNPTTALPSNQ